MSFLTYIFGFLLTNFYNVYCDPNLKTRGACFLDLDLTNVDIREFSINKSKSEPEAYKITVKSDKKINSIRINKNVVWSRKNSECVGMTIHNIERQLLFVFNIVEDGEIYNFHYYKDETLDPIGVIEFLSLLNGKLKPLESNMTLNVSDEYSKIFYDYTEKSHSDFTYESFEPDAEYEIDMIIDRPIGIQSGIIDTGIGIRSDGSVIKNSEQAKDNKTGVDSVVKDTEHDKPGNTGTFEGKQDKLSPSATTISGSAPDRNDFIWRSLSKDKFCKKVEIYKKDGRYLFMSVLLNDDTYVHLEYKGDTIKKPKRSAPTEGSCQSDHLNTNDKPSEPITSKSGNGWELISERKFDMESGNMGLRLFKTMNDNPFKIEDGRIVKSGIKEDVIYLNKKNLFCSYTSNNIMDNLYVAIVPTNPGKLAKLVFEYPSEGDSGDSLDDTKSDTSEDDLQYIDVDDKEITERKKKHGRVELLYDFANNLKEDEKWTSVIILYIKLSNNTHYIEIIASKNGHRVPNRYFTYNYPVETRWVIRGDDWIRVPLRGSNTAADKTLEGDDNSGSDTAIQLQGIWSSLKELEYPRFLTNSIKTTLHYLEHFGVNGLESGHTIAELPSYIKEDIETSEAVPPGDSGDGTMDIFPDVADGTKTPDDEDVTIITREDVNVDLNDFSDDIDDSSDGITVPLNYVENVKEAEPVTTFKKVEDIKDKSGFGRSFTAILFVFTVSIGFLQ